ncbi:hypothetical protein P3L10_028498 [Capsicum annuum]
MESRSTVWEYFEKIFENGKLVKAACLHCHQNYATNITKNGTSGLRQHLVRCKMYKPLPTPSSGQTLLNFQTKDSSGEY